MSYEYVPGTGGYRWVDDGEEDPVRVWLIDDGDGSFPITPVIARIAAKEFVRQLSVISEIRPDSWPLTY